MPFPCTQCGACCRLVAHLGLPTKPGTTECVHYDASTRTCRTYPDRPLICRVDDLRPTSMPEAEWHERNAAACNELQRLFNLPTYLRVSLSFMHTPTGKG